MVWATLSFVCLLAGHAHAVLDACPALGGVIVDDEVSTPPP